MFLRIICNQIGQKKHLYIIRIRFRAVIINERQELFNSCHRPFILFFVFNLSHDFSDLNCRTINSVVFTMRADETDIHELGPELDYNH